MATECIVTANTLIYLSFGGGSESHPLSTGESALISRISRPIESSVPASEPRPKESGVFFPNS